MIRRCCDGEVRLAPRIPRRYWILIASKLTLFVSAFGIQGSFRWSACLAINITLGRTVAVARRTIDSGMNMLEMGAQKPAAAAMNASSYQVSIQRKLRAAILM